MAQYTIKIVLVIELFDENENLVQHDQHNRPYESTFTRTVERI